MMVGPPESEELLKTVNQRDGFLVAVQSGLDGSGVVAIVEVNVDGFAPQTRSSRAGVNCAIVVSK